MKNRLSFMTLGCPDWDLETVVKNAAAYGFGGVELRAQGEKHIDASLGAQGRRRVRALFGAHGVEIAALAGYSTFNTADAGALARNGDLLRANIALAADLGCATVRTFIGNLPEGMTLDQGIEIAAEHIAPCAARARDAGVTVVVETHDDYCDPRILRRVFDAMGEAGAKVLWDVQNAYTAGETGEGMADLFTGRIGHTHFRDCRMLPGGSHELVLMGEGEVPFERVMHNLERAGYEGWLSLEWEKMWQPQLAGPEVAFPNYVSYMTAMIGRLEAAR